MNWKYSGQQHLAYNTNKTKKDTVTCRNKVVRYVQKYLSLEISVQILLQNCEQFLNTFDPFCELVSIMAAVEILDFKTQKKNQTYTYIYEIHLGQFF